MIHNKRITPRLVAAFLALFMFFGVIPIKLVYGGSTTYLAGADRYQTAVAISQKGWLESEYVVLVRGDDFADALCAGPLAAKYNAPILFTEKYQLNSYTRDEIIRLNAKKIIIVGGYSALYGYIDQDLYAAGIDSNDIERIYGDNRYETSVEIAKRMGSKEVAIAVGDQYADALSISAVAATKGMSILLTTKDTLPDVVKRHLSNYKIDKTYVIGGTGVISQSVETQLPSPKRLAGNDRYDTNRKILEQFAADLDFNKIYIASGEGEDGYAEPLAGVVLAAKSSSPIVLGGQSVPEGTLNYLKTKMTVASKMVALGGVSYTVMDEYQLEHDRIRKSVFSQKGTYGPSTGTTTISGNLAIESDDIIVQNTVIEGDLLLGEGIGTGEIQLRNVTVKGRTTVRGGGYNTIAADNFTSKNLVIDLPNNRVVDFVLTGKSKVDITRLESSALLDDTNNSSDGFNEVRIINGQDITLQGTYTTVIVSANGTTLWMDASTIKTLNAKVKHLVDGSGTISTANISTNGVEITFAPAVTIVEKGYTAYIAGEYLEEGTHKAAAKKK